MDMISLKGKSIYNNQWFVAILAIVLFFINIRLIRILDGPFMFNDELGYLGNAAAFAGYDWHEIMQGCAWYSFGWSLILTPLFIVFDDMLIIYKSINVLNAILCVITFVLQYKLLTKCFCRLNNYYLALISFVTCCYPAVLINSSMAWSETWLLFMFVAITYFLLCMVNKPKLYKDIIWAFLLYYSNFALE